MDPSIVDGRSVSRAKPIRKLDTRTDIAVLICALFLQRFSLAFGNSLMSLDVVPATFILLHQFASGRLLIQYDRLLWFLGVGLAASISLFLNFKSTMLPSYCEFVVIYSLFTLTRPSSEDLYKETLQGFQFLVAALSFLAIAQFVAQFVVDGRQIISFYGIVPDFLFASFDTNRVNTIIPLYGGSSLIKSNGIFLTEPSTMSQIAALGLLIEILEFQRPRYLLLIALGLLLAYSGTGSMIVLLFLPLAGLGRKGVLPALLVLIFAFGLFATGIIDWSVFLSRTSEFEDTRASGFQRFISPFWLAADHFHTASAQGLLIGSGPGTTDEFVGTHYQYAGMSSTWIKLFYEYGLIGSFVFSCFFISCFRRTICPRMLVAAFIFYFVSLGGLLLNTPFLIMTIVLCTLHGAASRREASIRQADARLPLLPADRQQADRAG
jgi:hypothetical protein